jgi:hypothetical protein
MFSAAVCSEICFSGSAESRICASSCRVEAFLSRSPSSDQEAEIDVMLYKHCIPLAEELELHRAIGCIVCCRQNQQPSLLYLEICVLCLCVCAGGRAGKKQTQKKHKQFSLILLALTRRSSWSPSLRVASRLTYATCVSGAIPWDTENVSAFYYLGSSACLNTAKRSANLALLAAFSCGQK